VHDEGKREERREKREERREKREERRWSLK
jgi:hypothetical protein